MDVAVFRVFRERNAGLYLSAVLASGFGSTAMWLVAGIWVKSLTGSDSLAALTAFALWAPLLAGPLLGKVVDRTLRRPLLVVVNTVMAILLLLLLLVDSADRVWLLFGVLLAYGVGGCIHEAAESALLAAAVDTTRLGDVNGLRMAVNEGVKLVAPLTAAALFARFGGASVAVLDAATFALAAGIFLLLRISEERPARSGRAAGGTAWGARLLWHSPVLRPLLLAGGATMLLAGLNGALGYAVVDRVLGRPPAFLGVLYAAQGAGSVVTGLVAGPLLRRLPGPVFAAGGMALFSVAVALRTLPYDPAAVLCSAAVGLGLPCVLIAAMTAVQRETPPEVLGRTAAAAQTFLFVPNAVALALGAGLVALVDVRVLLPLMSLPGLVTAGLLLATGPVGAVRS
ncbi:MFS transporter [Streptomyces sp. NPDC059175]|uniref:MFS transporter n=1 Tax=Streptomyces sp. NPDC059175 TaxID=3346757 RepID=UPI0036B9DEED